MAQGTDTRLVGKNANIRKYPLEQVQIFAYHSDVSTTQSYLKDHSDDTINEMFGFSEYPNKTLISKLMQELLSYYII